MKQTIDTLKRGTAPASVRATAAAAVIVPLAAILGGVSLQHNETLVRDRPS